ncbi:hypothetical protein H632_c292p0 [Helicosporidium sp. ATCC 50920]|nr:hypothetical protein H632_c292p0 [Helicosporidium sp. ATCC 50920]|eukprot:KDD76264.1 hypothetical protein H632_c292p0 [Helicosporidium sp. ATCC 50920]
MSVANEGVMPPLEFIKQQKLSFSAPGLIKRHVEEWLGTQPLWTDVSVTTAMGAAQGAALGLVMGALTKSAADANPAAFSLVSAASMPGVPPSATKKVMSAISGGAMFALFQAAIHRFFGDKKNGKGIDAYVRVRSMLQNLGLQEYEQRLKRGLLDDRTMALWNDSALAEAKIPPGPRLLILDHIDQYRDILRPAIGIEEHL